MAYIGKSPSRGVRNRFQYQATAGQQTFSSADANGLTLTYTDSLYMDVYQNGILLVPGDDYTATTGTTVVLVQAASLNDIVEMVVYDVFSVPDAVSQSAGGTFSGNVTMAGTLGVTGATTLSGDLTIPDKIIHSGDTNTAIRFPSADTVTIETGGSERARVDSSGNVLVGKTSTGAEVAGITLGSSGFASFTRDGNIALFLNRETNDGTIVEFRKDNTAVGSIAVASSQLSIDGGSGRFGIGFGTGGLIPRDGGSDTDGQNDVGAASNRFDDIRATNGSIETSDRNEKQDIEELTDAEKRVAVACKGLMRKYRWKDKVAEKGDDARTHFGIIAQDLEDAFKAEGLDASKYAMFCSDTWWYVDEKYIDDNGKEQTRTVNFHIKEEAPKDAIEKTRLGVRYSELLAFIISAI